MCVDGLDGLAGWMDGWWVNPGWLVLAERLEEQLCVGPHSGKLSQPHFRMSLCHYVWWSTRWISTKWFHNMFDSKITWIIRCLVPEMDPWDVVMPPGSLFSEVRQLYGAEDHWASCLKEHQGNKGRSPTGGWHVVPCGVAQCRAIMAWRGGVVIVQFASSGFTTLQTINEKEKQQKQPMEWSSKHCKSNNED